MDAPKLEPEQLLMHSAWLRRFAYALVRDEDLGHDVTQDTLVTAWQDPPPAEAKARSWLARVAQNRARDLHRSELRRRKREQEVSELDTEAQTPEQLVGNYQLHRKLAALVTSLDEPFRKTLVLRYYDGLTAAEIAQRLDVPAGTVRWRLKEGLARLKKGLDAEHGGNRKNWLLALAPLVSQRKPTDLPRLVQRNWASTLVTIAVVGGASLLLVTRGATRQETERSLGAASKKAIAERSMDDVSKGAFVPPLHLVAAADQEDEPPSHAAPAAADPEAMVRYMLAAIADSSYDDFLVYADNELKAHLHKDALDSLSNDLGPRLQQGYNLLNFGTLQHEGDLVHLWKIEFHDGSDDQLLRVTMKDGRAKGFLIQ